MCGANWPNSWTVTITMNDMRVLVTSGGTLEDIDTVRAVVNHSTGSLGSLIAQRFALGGAQVVYLRGEKAACPQTTPHQTITIRGTSQLSVTLKELLNRQRFDCVIHAMAVSDFTPAGTLTAQDIAIAIGEQLNAGQPLTQHTVTAALHSATKTPGRAKISSRDGDLLLALKQTPKVIEMIKALQPNTLLVGFKLLSGASESELIAAGNRLTCENKCDFVLLNDLADINGDKHKAMLLQEGQVVGRAATKQEIASLIFDNVTRRLTELEKIR